MCTPTHAAGVEAQQALKAVESTMTVCEVATHRIFVALLHSRHLHRHPVLRQQWVEALDGLGGFVDLIPGRTWHDRGRREHGGACQYLMSLCVSLCCVHFEAPLPAS